ncbi:MAG: leucyl aminopeptidase [Nitrospiraceae bacterium]|nr:leucyl aminopeptidase [Nitrospiraceae bacterium]
MAMNLTIKNVKERQFPCNALILPVVEGELDYYSKISPETHSFLKKISTEEFSGKHNEVLLIHSPKDIKPQRLLFIGLGKKTDISPEKLRQAGGKAAAYLAERGIKKTGLSTSLIESLKLSSSDFIEGSLLSLYKFRKYLKKEKQYGIDILTLLAKPSQLLKEKLIWAKTAVDAVNFARDLINTPSNDMTPTHLAKTALSLRKKNLSVKVLGRIEAEKLGMGAYLSVSKGSHQPPKFILLEYRGKKSSSKIKPLVLIGKSITFDSGGISLKPSENMEKMKDDMSGGAAVLGIFKAVSEAELPIHIVGILPATENLPGGSATKPGDIVKALDGKTIEIINTDAEGRLVLADAITYAKHFNPSAIIDIATLTGACTITFGNEAIAMMGNNRELLDKIKKSSERTYERAWEMPLFDEYKDYLKSDIADIKNTGGRSGSLITAAYFLYEFAQDTPWVHLDIASTAWIDKEKPYLAKGASGIGVRLILDFIAKELKTFS